MRAAAIFAALAVLAAGLFVSGAAPACLPFTAGPIVLAGAAWPLILRWTPVEPSRFKLLFYSALLAPPLVVLAWLACIPWLRSDHAFAAVMALCAAVQGLAYKQRTHTERLGRALTTTIFCGVAVTSLLVLVGLGAGAGSFALRPGALAQAGLLQALERWPLENPWLAGTALDAPATRAAPAALALVFARACVLDPLRAQLLMNAWALFLAILASGLCAAALWRSTWPVTLAAPLAFVAWGGLEPFLVSGPHAPALASALGAFSAASHALRHGRRPWVLLTVLLHTTAFVLHPVLGGAALASTVLAFLTIRFEGRKERRAGPSGGANAGSAWPRLSRPGQGAILTLMVCAALAPLAVGLAFPDEQSKLATRGLAGAALGILVSGLAGRGAVRIPVLRGALALVLALVLALGVWRARSALVGLPAPPGVPLAWIGEVLQPTGDAHLATAYRWLREDYEPDAERRRQRRPILVTSLDPGPLEGSDLAPHPDGLYADLPLWCGRRPELGSRSPRFAPRFERNSKLFRARKDWDPGFVHEFQRLGRPVVLIVEEKDRLATHPGEENHARRGIDFRLERVGCDLLHESGSVAIYGYDPGPGPGAQQAGGQR